jgi:hypothetical protein
VAMRNNVLTAITGLQPPAYRQRLHQRPCHRSGLSCPFDTKTLTFDNRSDG